MPQSNGEELFALLLMCGYKRRIKPYRSQIGAVEVGIGKLWLEIRERHTCIKITPAISKYVENRKLLKLLRTNQLDSYLRSIDNEKEEKIVSVVVQRPCRV